MAPNKTTIDHLPIELLIEILSRAGEKDSATVFTAKSTCKRFNEASNDKLVFKRLSLERFSIVSWFPHPREIECLHRCLEAGNPHAIFRSGLFHYFHHNQPDLGILMLKSAAESGQLEAVFIFGLILLASGVEDSKSEGLEMLNRTFASNLNIVEEIRLNVLLSLRRLWCRNPRPFQDTMTRCQVAGHLGYVTNLFASVMTHAECLTCFWCHELEMVVRHL